MEPLSGNRGLGRPVCRPMAIGRPCARITGTLHECSPFPPTPAALSILAAGLTISVPPHPPPASEATQPDFPVKRRRLASHRRHAHCAFRKFRSVLPPGYPDIAATASPASALSQNERCQPILPSEATAGRNSTRPRHQLEIRRRPVPLDAFCSMLRAKNLEPVIQGLGRHLPRSRTGRYRPE